jgi:hypothetical protein
MPLRLFLVLALLPCAACGSSDSTTSVEGAGGNSAGGDTSQTPGSDIGGGGGDRTSPDTVEPVEVRYEGDQLRISVGSLVMLISPQSGGRIVEFSRDGHQVLLSSDVESALYGSTFWTSPQSDWDWPPPAEIDESSYEVSLQENSALLTGPESPALAVHVEKRFEPLSTERVIRVTYTIVNRSEHAVHLAPWEVTRVPAGGLTFFPAGTLTLDKSNLETTSQLGHVWYASSGHPLPTAQKHFADGEHGWLAHAHRGALFVKSFEDIAPSDFAPGQAEVEIFANQQGTYVELEQQGVYRTIPAGNRHEWSVEWRLELLPTTLPVTPGSEQLVNAVADALE